MPGSQTFMSGNTDKTAFEMVHAGRRSVSWTGVACGSHASSGYNIESHYLTALANTRLSTHPSRALTTATHTASLTQSGVPSDSSPRGPAAIQGELFPDL